MCVLFIVVFLLLFLFLKACAARKACPLPVLSCSENLLSRKACPWLRNCIRYMVYGIWYMVPDALQLPFLSACITFGSSCLCVGVARSCPRLLPRHSAPCHSLRLQFGIAMRSWKGTFRSQSAHALQCPMRCMQMARSTQCLMFGAASYPNIIFKHL